MTHSFAVSKALWLLSVSLPRIVFAKYKNDIAGQIATYDIMKREALFRIALAIISIALSAQVTIDAGSIPITGQTLAILMVALLLIPSEAIIAVIGYLILAMVGLPVLADGASGIEKFTGGSAGFLLGFVIATITISTLSRHQPSTLLWILIWTAAGTAIIMISGVARLSMMYGLQKGWEYGFMPFWQGAIIKVAIGSVLVWGVRMIINRRRSDHESRKAKT